MESWVQDSVQRTYNALVKTEQQPTSPISHSSPVRYAAHTRATVPDSTTVPSNASFKNPAPRHYNQLLPPARHALQTPTQTQALVPTAGGSSGPGVGREALGGKKRTPLQTARIYPQMSFSTPVQGRSVMRSTFHHFQRATPIR